MVGRHTDTPHIIVFWKYDPVFSAFFQRRPVGGDKGEDETAEEWGVWTSCLSKQGFFLLCSGVSSTPTVRSQRWNPFLTTRHWLNGPLWHLHLKLVPPNGLMYPVIALQAQRLSRCCFVSTSAEEVTFPPLSVGWLLCVQDDAKTTGWISRNLAGGWVGNGPRKSSLNFGADLD